MYTFNRTLHLPIMTCYNHSASTSLLSFLDEVYLIEPFALVGNFELLSKAVISNASCEDNRFGRQDILRKNYQSYPVCIII